MDTNPTAHAAQVVAAAMAAKGVTQVELSEATGIPRTTLIRRLRAQQSFTVNELAAIAEHLDTTVSQMLAVAEDVPA